jgi:hypothetical protein
MTRSYDIISEFGLKDEEADQVTLNPGAVIAFFRYNFPVTYSRNKKASFSNYLPYASELRGKPVVVVNDIFQVSVQSTKANHTTQMSCSLYNGMNYLTEILPGDYAFVWMVQDKETLESLVDRIQKGEKCNGFFDGLKFFGKVTGVRKKIQQSPQGPRTSTYNINAAGFTELDANIFYEPYLSIGRAERNLGIELLKTLGTNINEVVASNGRGLAINKIIPLLFKIFYGAGIPPNHSIKNGSKTTQGLDNPNAFVVPGAVAKLFGVTSGTKPNGMIGFSDIAELIHGIQKYTKHVDISSEDIPELRKEINESTTEPGQKKPGDKIGGLFSPDFQTHEGRTRFTGDDQLGTFLPQAVHFTGEKSVWSIMQQYLNPTVNEMYSALKVNPRGDVMPSVILRQLPFSSGIISESFVPEPIKTTEDKPKSQKTGPSGPQKLTCDPSDAPKLQSDMSDAPKLTCDPSDAPKPKVKILTESQTNARVTDPNAPTRVEVTRFTELPRWKIHPIFIKSADVGRSDSLRFNFVHVQGESGLKSDNRTGSIVRTPAIADQLDIARSGLRTYMATVNCSQIDIRLKGATIWQYILSDILMGQHLTLTGTLDCYGMQAPIAVGENLEFDETVFHIEAISHQFSISITGVKTFSSSFALTHGVGAAQSTGSDTSLYSGIHPSDLTAYDARNQTDYLYSEPDYAPASDPKDTEDARTKVLVNDLVDES